MDTASYLEFMVAVLGHISWPLVVLLTAVVLRREIPALLGRLKRAELPGGTVVEFGSRSDKRAMQEGERVRASTEEREPNASPDDSVFWLGHDLMLTIDALLRNAGPEDIFYGLNQSLFHLGRVRLWESAIGQELREMRDEAKNRERVWTLHYREAAARDLRELIGELGRHFAK